MLISNSSHPFLSYLGFNVEFTIEKVTGLLFSPNGETLDAQKYSERPPVLRFGRIISPLSFQSRFHHHPLTLPAVTAPPSNSTWAQFHFVFSSSLLSLQTSVLIFEWSIPSTKKHLNYATVFSHAFFV